MNKPICRECNGEGRVRNIYMGFDVGEKKCSRCKGNGVEPTRC